MDDKTKRQNETAILSESALSTDWNRAEEEVAWSHLNPAHPMQFTHEQLARLSRWEPLHPEFDRSGGAIEHRLLQVVIQPLISELNGKDYRCTVLENGGQANYYGIWVRNAVDHRELEGISYLVVPGVTVYLSLLSPFAAIGRVAGDYFAKSHHMSLENIISRESSLSDLESGIVEALSKTFYTILRPSDLSQVLPADIAPYEFCFSPQPWNTVFHVMFSNSD